MRENRRYRAMRKRRKEHPRFVYKGVYDPDYADRMRLLVESPRAGQIIPVKDRSFYYGGWKETREAL